MAKLKYKPHELDGLYSYQLVNMIREDLNVAKSCRARHWATFSIDNLEYLLSKWPQLIDKCDHNKLNGEAWAGILAKQPELADKCDFDKLRGCDWIYLLIYQPHFYNICQWDKLTGRNWVEIIYSQPQFIDKCDWGKVRIDDWHWMLSDISPYWLKLDDRDINALLHIGINLDLPNDRD